VTGIFFIVSSLLGLLLFLSRVRNISREMDITVEPRSPSRMRLLGMDAHSTELAVKTTGTKSRLYN